jgi:CheY-like chemotaxis protein
MVVKKVLLADDDMDDVYFMSDFIKQSPGYILLPTAENGTEVVNYLNGLNNEPSQLPDIILLDHNMPKMTGLQTLHFIKSSNKFAHIPVIIYSTYLHDNLVSECRHSGAALVTTKPESLAGYRKMMEDVNKIISDSNNL